MIVWDRGSWSPVGDPREGLAQGKLVFDLHGQKLAGRWELVRIRKPGEERQDPWILFKKRDAHARPRAEYDVVSALPDSVVAKPLAPPPALAAPKPRARPRQADAAAAEALPGAPPCPPTCRRSWRRSPARCRRPAIGCARSSSTAIAC